ncbi:hypothetical protein GJAV_G00075770 [Gymnothorax javanicus]|nr:hypothetical protein GJAV_G00075770 [Gymnothorax javanicus]
MNDFEERLAEIVKGHVHLYDRSRRDYDYFKKAAISWKEIARKLGKDPRSCKVAWRNLRDKFVKTKKKLKRDSRLSGGAQVTPKLCLQLSWMDSYVRHRPGRSHLPYLEEDFSYDESVKPEIKAGPDAGMDVDDITSILIDQVPEGAAEREMGNLTTVEEKEKGKSTVEWGLLESPWREVGFSVEKNEALLDSVSSYKPGCDAVSEARVLLLGPVGAGKSSFISSVHSVFSGRVTNRAMVGTSSTGFTQKLRSYAFRRRGSSGDQPVSFVLCDAMALGMDGMTGLTLHDVLAVIKGHAPEGHKFNRDQPLTAEMVGYVKNPSAREKMHCVAFVVDSTKIDSYGQDMSSTFQQLREEISDLGVHQVALLTHVDQLCPDTALDITNVYRSRRVKQMMETAAALLGMSMSYIVPVKNYSCELDVDEHTNTLLLCAVQHILEYVDLYFQDFTEF